MYVNIEFVPQITYAATWGRYLPKCLWNAQCYKSFVCWAIKSSALPFEAFLFWVWKLPSFLWRVVVELCWVAVFKHCNSTTHRVATALNNLSLPLWGDFKSTQVLSLHFQLSLWLSFLLGSTCPRQGLALLWATPTPHYSKLLSQSLCINPLSYPIPLYSMAKKLWLGGHSSFSGTITSLGFNFPTRKELQAGLWGGDCYH